LGKPKTSPKKKRELEKPISRWIKTKNSRIKERNVMNKLKSLHWRGSILARWLLVFTCLKSHAIPIATANLLADNSSSAVFGTINGAYDSTAQATASAVAGSYVSAEANGSSVNGGVAQAIQTYYFEIIGPVGGGNVPIVVEASGQAESAGISTGARALISVSSGNGFSAFVTAGQAYGAGSTSLLSVEKDLTLSANVLDGVTLEATVQAFVDGRTSASVVDPQIFINPTFPDASGDRISFSPNVRVPDGFSTLGLLGSSLVGLVVCRRRAIAGLDSIQWR
jgi:hypothetical protein